MEKRFITSKLVSSMKELKLSFLKVKDGSVLKVKQKGVVGASQEDKWFAL